MCMNRGMNTIIIKKKQRSNWPAIPLPYTYTHGLMFGEFILISLFEWFVADESKSKIISIVLNTMQFIKQFLASQDFTKCSVFCR